MNEPALARPQAVVDVHTHLYPPIFIDLLKARTEVPYIREVAGSDTARLIILPGEDDESKPPEARGRPLGPDFWDIGRKIAFMDRHGIDCSIVSLANPWLDFLHSSEALRMAGLVNDQINALCSKVPDRLWAFGTLLLSGSIEDVQVEIQRLRKLDRMRGVIMGTSGFGQGLDDPALDPVYQALVSEKAMIFLHPHYGLPNEVYGPRVGDYGHVLSLALGFPLETTIAVTRMYLSGVFDRHPNLRVLLAHSGGTLPFLAGRIESCIEHDRHLATTDTAPKRSIWDVITTNIWLDAVIYSSAGLMAAAETSGVNRLMFGTDHPFFSPLDQGEQQWVDTPIQDQSMFNSFRDTEGIVDRIVGGNAIELFNLKPPVELERVSSPSDEEMSELVAEALS